ncbi:MAG: hypothetical protein ACNS60_05185 [Candidatus Cyclobacteriaceae bacterium M2_1C_046]
MDLTKKIFLIYLIIVAVTAGSCENDRSAYEICNETGGIEISNMEGRVYKSLSGFYYIGNVKEVTQGVNGGYIPCNGLPDKFQKGGMLVVFTGVDKGSYPDHDDPLYAYILLTSIEILN